MATRFHSDRWFSFDVPADDLWGALTATDRFQTWWPWLTRFDLGRLEPGAEARCEINAPLPYRLNFTVHVTDLVPQRHLVGAVAGDLEGPAHLTVEPVTAGRSRANLGWQLRVRRPLLHGLAVVARPVMQWGHDHIIEAGVHQFVDRALERD